jgi:hypothetical protein
MRSGIIPDWFDAPYLDTAAAARVFWDNFFRINPAVSRSTCAEPFVRQGNCVFIAETQSGGPD